MRPIGHIFDVSTDTGKRTITDPIDLAKRHKKWHSDIIGAIPPEEMEIIFYSSLGVIKVVNGWDVYYTVVEKIQDRVARPILVTHTMVFLLDDLVREKKTLLPPLDKEAYTRLGIPSDLHRLGRNIEDIKAAIAECVAEFDVETRTTSVGWNTGELNWLLDHPRTDISDPHPDFSPDRAISDFLMSLPAFVSARLNFATTYLPRKSDLHINITAHRGNTPPRSSKNLSIFRKEADFKADLEAAQADEIMKSKEEGEVHYQIVEQSTRKDVLEILRIFRTGLGNRKSQAAITTELLARSIVVPESQERVIDVCDQFGSYITKFPSEEKELIGGRFIDVLRGSTASDSIKVEVERVLKDISPQGIRSVSRRGAIGWKSPDERRNSECPKDSDLWESVLALCQSRIDGRRSKMTDKLI